MCKKTQTKKCQDSKTVWGTPRREMTITHNKLKHNSSSMRCTVIESLSGICNSLHNKGSAKDYIKKLTAVFMLSVNTMKSLLAGLFQTGISGDWTTSQWNLTSLQCDWGGWGRKPNPTIKKECWHFVRMANCHQCLVEHSSKFRWKWEDCTKGCCNG